MASLFLYIGAGVKFDVDAVKRGLMASPYARLDRAGFGSIFCCEYHTPSDVAPIRIKEGEQTIVVEGMGEASLIAAMDIQRLCTQPVRIFDESYTFDLPLAAFSTPKELERAITDAGA